MCGITGFITAKINSQELKQSALSDMLGVIRYRGPDDRGMFFDADTALANARLSIIDIAGGHQPVHNEDKTVWLVFNGEIYNYTRLKKELTAQGHTFYTHSDTEVIVHLYEEYGPACLERLEGMFAIAIWDKNKQLLFLGRDRFGIKPLYYARLNGEFVFASEAKAILKFPGFNKEIDPVALDQYLTFEYVPGPRSIFKGIKKLPAACFLTYDCASQEERIAKYWELNFNTGHDTAEPAVRLAQILRDAVERHLVSDVPVGIFLSGGIDSSMLLALARKINPARVKTFSMGFKEDSFDESRYIKKVAALFETEHHHYTFDHQDLLDAVLLSGSLLDEPLADASFFPTYLLAQFSRRETKAVLSGDGGDEVFAGYPTYQAHKLARYYNWIPSLVRHNLIDRLINSLPVSLANFSLDFRMKKLVSCSDLPAELRHIFWMGAFTHKEKTGLYPDSANTALNKDAYREVLKNHLEGFRGREGLDKLQYVDIKTYLEDDILVKADRASMLNSLEVRLPYLDRELAEFVFSLPPDLRLKGLKTKYIFKRTAARFLPADIVNRKKKGFGIPLGFWIKRQLKGMVTDLLAEKNIKKSGFFDPGYIANMLEQHLKDKADNRKKIWTIFMFQLWFDQYMTK